MVAWWRSKRRKGKQVRRSCAWEGQAACLGHSDARTGAPAGGVRRSAASGRAPIWACLQHQHHCLARALAAGHQLALRQTGLAARRVGRPATRHRKALYVVRLWRHRSPHHLMIFGIPDCTRRHISQAPCVSGSSPSHCSVVLRVHSGGGRSAGRGRARRWGRTALLEEGLLPDVPAVQQNAPGAGVLQVWGVQDLLLVRLAPRRHEKADKDARNACVRKDEHEDFVAIGECEPCGRWSPRCCGPGPIMSRAGVQRAPAS